MKYKPYFACRRCFDDIVFGDAYAFRGLVRKQLAGGAMRCVTCGDAAEEMREIYKYLPSGELETVTIRPIARVDAPLPRESKWKAFVFVHDAEDRFLWTMSEQFATFEEASDWTRLATIGAMGGHVVTWLCHSQHCRGKSATGVAYNEGDPLVCPECGTVTVHREYQLLGTTCQGCRRYHYDGLGHTPERWCERGLPMHTIRCEEKHIAPPT